MKDYHWNRTIGEGGFARWQRSNEPPIGEGVAILQCPKCGRHFRTDHKWRQALCPICDPPDAKVHQAAYNDADPEYDLRPARRRRD